MRTVTLGEVAEIVSGATPKSIVNDYWGGDVLWATPADLSKLDGPYISTTPRTLTKAGLASCAAAELPAGSVLLSSRAPIGHVAINAEPMATNQGFKSLVPQVHRLDAKYLYHWLRSKTAYLQSLGNGATFKELPKSTVARVELPLPPLDEQRRAAAILDQADALRAKHRQVLAHLDVLVHSVFRGLFGDPIRNMKGLPVRPLADWVCPERPITYGILKPGPDIPNGVPYVRVADMKERGVDVSGVRRTTRVIADEYRRSVLQAGDLLVSIRGHVGRLAFVPDELAGANITQDSARLSVGSPQTAHYLRLAMETSSCQHWMARRTKGAAVKGINLGDLRELPLPVPSFEEMDRFAATARSIERRRSTVRAALSVSEGLFASVQSRAFRGEL